MAMITEAKIWYEDIGREWIAEFIPSLDKMIQDKDSRKGVYAILVDNIYAYIGEAGKGTNRTITDRLCEHAYHIASNPKCFFGIPYKHINNHTVKISVKCLKEENDMHERKKHETNAIEEKKPYTQDPNKRRGTNNGPDSCIPRTRRHEAYLEASNKLS